MIEISNCRMDHGVYEPIIEPPCLHIWKPSGMFLVKIADTRDSQGCVNGRKIVGGNEGYWPHQTPEVEVCERCGLLRIAPPISEGAP